MIERPREFVVLDTNVIFSSLLFRNSEPRRALVLAFEQGIVCSSSKVRNELREVLGRSKFDRYVARENRLRDLEDLTEDMEPSKTPEGVRLCRDPRDDMFLELALAAQADILITGDADLLAPRMFYQTTIRTPADYLAR